MTQTFQQPWLLPLALGLCFSYNCEPIGESTVGSPSDTEISRVAFLVDTTYTGGLQLYAKGRVQNTGSNTISPPWYVECQFYTDATFSIKLGGNYASISAPLSPGQSAFWTMSFSSSNVDVRKFPDFRVKDLRAVYKK